MTKLFNENEFVKYLNYSTPFILDKFVLNLLFKFLINFIFYFK